MEEGKDGKAGKDSTKVCRATHATRTQYSFELRRSIDYLPHQSTTRCWVLCSLCSFLWDLQGVCTNQGGSYYQTIEKACEGERETLLV